MKSVYHLLRETGVVRRKCHSPARLCGSYEVEVHGPVNAWSTGNELVWRIGNIPGRKGLTVLLRAEM